MNTLTKTIAALTLLAASPAFAAGVITLKGAIKKGVILERLPGMPATVKAPPGTQLAKKDGSLFTGDFLPVHGKMNAKRTAIIYKLAPGQYFAPKLNKGFQVMPMFAIEPRPM